MMSECSSVHNWDVADHVLSPFLSSCQSYRSIYTHSWWKAKIKDESDEDAPVGLIPATYVEEVCLVLLDTILTPDPAYQHMSSSVRL